MKNKKAEISTLPVDFYAVLTLIVLFILFFGILYVTKVNVEVSIKNEEVKRDVDLMLINLLKYPHEKGTITDLFIENKLKNDFTESKKLVVNIVSNYFSANYNSPCCWKFRLSSDGKTVIDEDGGGTPCSGYQSEKKFAVKSSVVFPYRTDEGIKTMTAELVVYKEIGMTMGYTAPVCVVKDEK